MQGDANPSQGSLVARHTIQMLGGQGLRFVIRAAYFVEIARSLGSSNYGAFIGVLAVVGIATPFADLGSGSLLIKYASRDRRLFPTYWGNGLLSTLAASSLLIAAVMMVASLVLPGSIPHEMILLLALADIPALALITIAGEAFQALDQLQWTALLTAMISASRLIGATVLISRVHHPNPLEWARMYAVSTVCVAIAGIAGACWKLGLPRFGVRTTREDLREGLYFSFGQSAQTVYDNIDKTMLTRLSTFQATGIYGAAYRLIEVSFVPVLSVLHATYPNFFRTGKNGIAACHAYAKRSFRWALGYAALVSAFLLLAAGFIPLLLGKQYAEAVEATRWLAALPLLKVFSYFYSNMLSGSGYQPTRAGMQIAVAAFNVGLNLWLLPAFSWRGAAWSSLASDALLSIGTGWLVYLHSRRERLLTLPNAALNNSAG